MSRRNVNAQLSLLYVMKEEVSRATNGDTKGLHNSNTCFDHQSSTQLSHSVVVNTPRKGSAQGTYTKIILPMAICILSLLQFPPVSNQPLKGNQQLNHSCRVDASNSRQQSQSRAHSLSELSNDSSKTQSRFEGQNEATLPAFLLGDAIYWLQHKGPGH
jgi:hypothetical protein